MPTRYELHVRDWSDCRRCGLHQTRLETVLGRGQVPADVVFIGEAPGQSENVLGVPFVGPAGHVLDKVIEQSLTMGETYAITNLIACLPLDEAGRIKRPTDEAVTACAPRLRDFVDIADPKLLVLVGKEAADWTDPAYRHAVVFRKTIPRVEITHPAHILRAPVVHQPLMVKRCVIAIRGALDALRTKESV